MGKRMWSYGQNDALQSLWANKCDLMGKFSLWANKCILMGKKMFCVKKSLNFDSEVGKRVKRI